MGATSTAAPSHNTVWALTTAAVTARCVHLVAELGVPDLIDEEPVPVDVLAARCAIQAGPLDRVLRVLVAHGIFERRHCGYAHTDGSRLLRADHPRSLRAVARMFGLPLFWSSFARLEHSLRTGAASVEMVEPSGLAGYLGNHPDEARILYAATAECAGDVNAVLEAYGFQPFRTIAVIGGGGSRLLTAVLDAVPTVRGVVFDIADAIAPLSAPPERLTFQSGDVFVDPLPSADAYILKEVIHRWSDRQALDILTAIRHAASPGATVLIIDGVDPDSESDPGLLILDLTMLALTGGRHRTANELRILLHNAGFRVTAVLDTNGPLGIVEAVAV